MFTNFGSFIVAQLSAFKASPAWRLPTVVFAIAEGLFLISKILGIDVRGPVIPISFGLIKDLLDVVIVIIFPWHGWVFAVQVMVVFVVGINYRYLMVIYLLSTIATALISSFFNFRDLSIEKITVDILTYGVINVFVFVFVFAFMFLLKSIIKGVLKCHQ